MPKAIWIDQKHSVELVLSELSGTLGITRGEAIQAIADSQNVRRQTVYYWIKAIYAGERPDLEVRLNAAIKKVKKEKGV